VALEMIEQVPDLECLVVPVGGGGLIGGMAVAAKSLEPGIEVIGAEATLFPAIKSVMDGHDRTSGGDTLAEGIAVTEIGRFTMPVVRQHVDDILLAEEDELEHAVTLLLNIEKTLVEGAGAAGVAVVDANRERFQGKRVGVVLSGGNIDSRLLASILMRELVREGRITQLRVSMSDVPGQIARVAEIVSKRGGSFIEVQHHRIFTMLPAKDIYVDIVVETRDRQHLDLILADLRKAEYAVSILDQEAPH